jgi:hypothetical protein
LSGVNPREGRRSALRGRAPLLFGKSLFARRAGRPGLLAGFHRLDRLTQQPVQALDHLLAILELASGRT